MNAATERRSRARDARLLVIDESGGISHLTHRDLPSLLRHGDLVVANDAATVPASLAGVHVRTGANIEARLAGLPSEAFSRMLSGATRPWPARFTAIVFGAGDHRTATEYRSAPPVLQVGDALIVASLRARVVAFHGHPRLIELEFDRPTDAMWEGIARHGRPIQYAHVPQPLAVWDTWTSIASNPVAFEAPSAGFVLDWSMLGDLRRHGIRFATLTHAAGISSTGEPELDARLPFDEPYAIPSSTAVLIELTHAEGGRIVAIGTTVVRALEDSARRTGHVTAGDAVATGRIGPETQLRVVDAIVSGVHEPGTSHNSLLRAFQDDAAIGDMWNEAERHGYLAHEFGDAVFVTRQNIARCTIAA